VATFSLHRPNYRKIGAVRQRQDTKFDNYIAKMKGARKKRVGAGLKLLKTCSGDSSIDCVYWDDVNELVERLFLLTALYQAGNKSYTNEVQAISELYIIYKKNTDFAYLSSVTLSIERLSQDYATRLNSLHSDISKIRQFQIKKQPFDLIAAQLRVLIGLIVSHAQKLQAILSVCQSNKLTDLALNSTLLHEILDKIQLSLRNRNLKLAVPNHLFSYYYKMKFVHCGIINHIFLDIVRKVPVVAASSNYSVTQATPLNFLWNKNTCNLNFPKSLLITSKSNHTHIISEHSSPSCFSSDFST